MAEGPEDQDAHDALRFELATRVEMHRRRFLALAAAGTGSIVLAACSNGGGSDGSKGTSSSGATDAATTSTRPPVVPPAQGLETDPFTLGVASGDPLPRSVILWTRLAPDPLNQLGLFGIGDRDVQVLWELASDAGFDHVVASGIEPAAAEFGHSIHVDVEGLDPDTWYHYRFRVGTYASATGRTRTTPKEGATVDRLRLAFVSCQNRRDGEWTAYDHLAEDDLDLVFHLGDYIYEYPGGTGDTKTPLDAEPQTLADYRTVYAGYKLDPKLQKAHQVAPWVVTWDDHEVQNNYAGDVPASALSRQAFERRRKAAYQAFWEHHPVRIAPPAADGSLTVYRSFSFGKLATFLVLDGRQHRTDQPCGDKPTTAAACPALDDPDHTMLGTVQEEWLAKGLAASDTTWTVLAQQTVMKALVIGDTILNVDQWDGYPAARQRLFEAIDRAGLENVMVLTGDIHAAGAADLRMPSAGVKGKIVAHELVGTSISSGGLGKLIGDLDLTSIGIPYSNFVDHGYTRCTVTPERWTAEFVIVDTIAEPTSAAHVDATVDVLAGTPGIKVR
ncbi:MAG: alkaline phosphatase [Acidimicrobiales bacterium]|nr:alkaline phosphatase [Acidimicrobiales bacterium]